MAIVGESGCGKSVSSLAIMRLLPKKTGRITAGRVLFEGRNLLDLSDDDMREVRGRDIAMIFQEPMTSLNPVLTIGQQIMEPLFIHLKMSEGEARGRARSSCCGSSASPTASAGSSNIRITCPAACASA